MRITLWSFSKGSQKVELGLGEGRFSPSDQLRVVAQGWWASQHLSDAGTLLRGTERRRSVASKGWTGTVLFTFRVWSSAPGTNGSTVRWALIMEFCSGGDASWHEGLTLIAQGPPAARDTWNAQEQPARQACNTLNG